MRGRDALHELDADVGVIARVALAEVVQPRARRAGGRAGSRGRRGRRPATVASRRCRSTVKRWYGLCCARQRTGSHSGSSAHDEAVLVERLERRDRARAGRRGARPARRASPAATGRRARRPRSRSRSSVARRDRRTGVSPTAVATRSGSDGSSIGASSADHDLAVAQHDTPSLIDAVALRDATARVRRAGLRSRRHQSSLAQLIVRAALDTCCMSVSASGRPSASATPCCSWSTRWSDPLPGLAVQRDAYVVSSVRALGVTPRSSSAGSDVDGELRPRAARGRRGGRRGPP